MKKIIQSFTLLVFIMVSCKPDIEIKNEFNFNRSDFNESYSLIGEIIEFDKPLNPFLYKIIKDTLILVVNQKASYDGFKYLEFYNLNSMALITKILPRGRGPNELLSCRISYNNNSDEILVHDIVTNRSSIYIIDSVLSKGELYNPAQMKIPSEVGAIDKINKDNLVANNKWFFKHSEYGNKIEKRLFIMSKSGIPEQKIEDNKKLFFTPNVSQGFVSVSPLNDKIIYTDYFDDRIEIYSKDLNLIMTLKGPDNFAIKYVLQNNRVRFDENKFYKAFYKPYCTEKSVYLLYCGANGIDNSENYRKPVEVFKINWDGELLCHYELDKYIYNISIDSEESYLYGTSWQKYGDYPKLIKYKL